MKKNAIVINSNFSFRTHVLNNATTTGNYHRNDALDDTIHVFLNLKEQRIPFLILNFSFR